MAENPARGQELWGYAAGIGGFLIAISSPVLGAIADASGPRKPWILGFSILGVIGCWMLWYATPGSAQMGLVMLAIVLSLIGMEFAAVFNNAMMPTLVPRADLGRLSGSAWGLGYLGGLVSLVLVLGFMSAGRRPGARCSASNPSSARPRHAGGRSGIGSADCHLVSGLRASDVLLHARRRAPKRRIRRHRTRSVRTLGDDPQAAGERSYFSFLVSSMFYRDALNALYAFGGIYAAGVLGWSIIQIGIFGILANLTGRSEPGPAVTPTSASGRSRSSPSRSSS